MKGRMRGKATRGERLSFGDYGLKALDAGWVTDRQIEAIVREIDGAWYNNPYRPVTVSSNN